MTGDQAQEQGLGEEYITYSSKTQNRKKKYSGTIKISTVCLKNKYSEWQGNNYKNNKVAMQDLYQVSTLHFID